MMGSRLLIGEVERNEEFAEQLLVSALPSKGISALTGEEFQKTTAEANVLNPTKEFLLKGWSHENETSGYVRSFYLLRHEVSVVDGYLTRGTTFMIPLSIVS
ncbi:hypothetical protein FGIG_12376 [Fasciola gigantica]|uniref:Uncharacterized protein n=1 Tax=Fasciola gigantica TaxID=46835 RepID=A0A504YZR0_FASGI|nr:hypothetical protein FGIG_12376 [Fasciola gigantica]